MKKKPFVVGQLVKSVQNDVIYVCKISDINNLKEWRKLDKNSCAVLVGEIADRSHGDCKHALIVVDGKVFAVTGVSAVDGRAGETLLLVDMFDREKQMMRKRRKMRG